MRAWGGLGINLSSIESLALRTALNRISIQLHDLSRAHGNSLVSPTSVTEEDDGTLLQSSFVTMGHTGKLARERKLAATSPVVLTDGGANGSATLSAPTAVVAGSAFATDNVLLRADGTSRGAQSSGVEVDDSGLRIREASGGWMGMASMSPLLAQQTHTAANTETTGHSVTTQSGMLNVAGRTLHCRAMGTWSGDVTSTVSSRIFRLKYGSTALWQYTATLGVAAGPFTSRWLFLCDTVTVSSGNTRTFGWFITEDSAGALSIIHFSDLAVARTPTTTGAVVVSITDQWDVNDGNTTWTTETCHFELGGLTA